VELVWGHRNTQCGWQASGDAHLDVDGDAKDEILFGVPCWTTRKNTVEHNMVHPDICYLADIDYYRPAGIFYAFEAAQKQNGICLVDPATGKIIWGIDFPITHLHDWGMLGDIDSTEPGMELFAMEKDQSKSFLYNSKGKLLSDGKELGGGHTARARYWKDGPSKTTILQLSSQRQSPDGI
jgi:hypothetical protein